jgi:adenylate cyclase
MRNNGTIDKYIGDAIMAFWGAPQINDNQIYDACKSALLCAKKIKELNKKWIKEGKCPFITRMGLHSDELIVGNLGSESRLQYSIIGENISLAEQLEGLNKKHNTSILISENVYKIIKDKFVARQVDFIKTFSDDKKLKVYELCEEK